MSQWSTVKHKTLPRPVERWSDRYLEHPLLLWSLLDTNRPTQMWTTVFKTLYRCFHFQICLLKTKSRSICFWPQTQMELLIIILSLIQKSVSLEARSPGQRWSLLQGDNCFKGQTASSLEPEKRALPRQRCDSEHTF